MASPTTNNTDGNTGTLHDAAAAVLRWSIANILDRILAIAMAATTWIVMAVFIGWIAASVAIVTLCAWTWRSDRRDRAEWAEAPEAWRRQFGYCHGHLLTWRAIKAARVAKSLT